MANFILAFRKTVDKEGGYVNDPDDPGGETYKGVARKMQPKWIGWHIIDLLKQQADFPANIDKNGDVREAVGLLYLSQFWNKILAEEIYNQDVAESIFDFAVNAGVGSAVYLAQMVVGANADGIIGSETIRKINAFNPDHFIAAYKVAKIDRYVKICEKRPTSKKYFFGWIIRALALWALMFSIQIAEAQTPLILHKTDKAEYNQYQYWCNQLVADTAEQMGKVTIVRRVIVPNDILLFSGDTLKAGTVRYSFTDPLDTVWYAFVKKDYKTNSTQPSPRFRSYYYEVSELVLIRNKIYRIPRRKPSVKDFYLNWKTNQIP